MNVFERVWIRVKAAASALTMRFPGGGSGWGIVGGGFDYRREVGDGTGNSMVMAVVWWIARNFPEARLRVSRIQPDGTYEDVGSHPMLALIAHPNPYYSGLLLWMATLLDWTISGNAYWVKVRNGSGMPVQLWWVPSSLIEPRWPAGSSSTEFVTHYEYRPGGGGAMRLDPEDVVHFRYGMDPANLRKGLSPLQAVIREVYSDDEASRFTASLLRNFGTPGLVVSPVNEQKGVTLPEIEANKTRLLEQFRGDRRGEPLVFSAPTNVTAFGFNPQQMDLRALRRIPEERVTAIFGIPAVVVGLGAGLERSTYNNVREANEAAYEQNLIPTQRLLAAELHAQLLIDFEPAPDQFEVDFDLSDVRALQEDRDAIVTRMQAAVQGGFATINEARHEAGLPDLGPSGDVFLRSMAVVEVPVGSTVDQVLAPKAVLPRTKALSGRERSWARQLLRDQRRLTATFADELVTVFDDLGERVAQAYEPGKGRKVQAPDPEDWRIAQQLLDEVNIEEWEQQVLMPAFVRHYTRTAELTWGSVALMLDLDLGFDLEDPVVRRILAEGGTRLALLDTDTQTRQAVMRALALGREAGDGIDALRRRIRDQVPAGRFGEAGVRYRSEMIARTETRYAQVLSATGAYEASGAVASVRAIDNQTGYNDDDCVARNEQVYSFEQARSLNASEHPNGTLFFLPVVRG